ncbi:Vacuolar protein 8, partial [Hondaea fermentalgiana]
GGGRSHILDGAGALGLASSTGGNLSDDSAAVLSLFGLSGHDWGKEEKRGSRKGKSRRRKKKTNSNSNLDNDDNGEQPGDEGGDRSGSRSKNNRAREAAQFYARLSRPPKKNFRVVELGVSTLRPLVDLAYWSTFTEVRRDAAAAFATLAMNDANLPVLSEAGALGAVIALIGMNNDVNDTVIQRDAAIALSFLVRVADVRSRFIKAPDGLRSVFYICRSSSIDVRRACANIFMELSRSAETKEALVESGGTKYLFALAQTTDEVTVRKATQVLKKLAAHGPNHEAIANDEAALKSMIGLLLDSPDLQIRRDMMNMVSSIASNNKRREELVQKGVLTPLLLHLDPQTSSLETILLVIQCLFGLSLSPDVLPAFVEEGVVENLSRVIFDELREIRKYRAMRPVPHSAGTGGFGRSTKRLLELAPTRAVAMQHQESFRQASSNTNQESRNNEEDACQSTLSNPRISEAPVRRTVVGGANGGVYASSKSSRSRGTTIVQAGRPTALQAGSPGQLESGPGGQRPTSSNGRGQDRSSRKAKVKSMAELEQDALRTGLTIMLHLAAQANLRDELVRRKLPTSLYEDTILQNPDKRVPRLVAKTLSYLAEAEAAGKRHTRLLESGILHPIRVFLRSRDFHLRTLTLSLAANLTIADQAKIELGSDLEMLKQFVGFCNIFDEDVNADLAVALARISEDVSTLPTLIRSRALDALMYMISPRSKNEVAKRESVRALGNLARDVGIKQEFVQSGALGHLISLSKSGNGQTKLYALQTLTALEHDTAAIRIQMVFRGYVARRNFNEVRRLASKQQAELMEARKSSASGEDSSNSSQTS